MDWRKWAQERGYAAACGDPGILAIVRDEIESRHASGELDEGLFDTYLKGHTYLNGADLPAVRSLLVVAVPRPFHRVAFQTEAGVYTALLPPTYGYFNRTAAGVRDDFTGAVLPPGSSAVLFRGAFKAIAVRLGLARYGRNNIAYVNGFGSYHQLVGLLVETDLDPGVHPEQGEDFTAICAACSACRRACPTGAIAADRFLIRAERCLTYLNEEPGEWPGWLPPAAHHCLLGCAACQETCPMNTGLTRFEDLAAFTREETDRILSGPPGDDTIWRDAAAKLGEIGLKSYAPLIGRNLRALMEAGRQG